MMWYTDVIGNKVRCKVSNPEERGGFIPSQNKLALTV